MKKKYFFRVTYLLILVTVFYLASFADAETIILKSGQKIEGKIVERTDKYVKIDFLGTVLTYFFNQIERIEEKTTFTSKKSTSSVSSSTSLTTFEAIKKEPQQIFKEVSPAIVYITTKTLTEMQYLGSGFIVHPSGVIVTNAHVVQSAKEIFTKLKNGSVYPVTGIIHYDVSQDFCLLKIDAQSLPAVTLGDSSSVQVGEKIYCIGNPLGLEHSFSDGMLSGIREQSGFKWLQFTAPISSGNSGGPILNSYGQIIGMVTFIMSEVGSQNLNFAIAINELKPFIFTSPKMTIKQFVETTSQADNYVTKGLEASLQNDLDQAILDYTKAIQINPNLAVAYYNRGVAYTAKGNFDQAFSDFNKTLQIDPNYVEAYNNRGVMYQSKGSFDQAISDFNKALQIYPHNVESYNNRGATYALKGNFDLAISDYTKAIQIKHHYVHAYYNRAKAYEAKLDFDLAISDYTKAIQIEPDNALFYHERGLAYLFNAYEDKSNIDQAILDFNKALQIDPNYADAYNNRVAAYSFKKEYDKAWQDVHKAEELGFGDKISPGLLDRLKKESGRER